MRRAGRNTDGRDKCKGITIDLTHIGWPTEGQKEKSRMKADNYVIIERQKNIDV